MSEENNDRKKKEFDITIDTAQTNEVIRLNERLKMENEELREKMALIAEKQIEAKMREYEIPMDRKSEFMSNPDALKDYAPKPTPAGSPLTPAQMGNQNDYDLYKRKFNLEKEMVDAILEDMHGTDARKAEIAKSYYEAMMLQWLRAKKHKQGLDDFYDPNQVQNLPDLRNEGSFRVPVRRDEGDIGKIMKQFRNERKRKSEEGAEK